MTASPPRPGPPGTRAPSSWGAGRVVALVLGILLLLPALALLLGGGVLLWADQAERRDDGFLMTADQGFTSPGFALTTETIDLDAGADWVPLSAALGDVRLEVTPSDPSSAVFVGFAPVADATAYLEGVERTVIDDVGPEVTAADQTHVSGGAPSGTPVEQDFWTAQVSGPGTQRLEFTPPEGDWMLVIMNADGSETVSVEAGIGASAPGLAGLAWGLLAGGLLLSAVAVLLLVLAIRPRRAAGVAYPPAQWPDPAPAGPPPSWAAPLPPPPPWAAPPPRGAAPGDTLEPGTPADGTRRPPAAG
jgi:uncharacterized integral membrane protein